MTTIDPSSLFSDTKRPTIYFVEVAGARYEALRVTGEEALSRPGRFEIVFRVPPGDGLDPDAVIGTEVTLALHRGGLDARRITWFASEVRRNATIRGNEGTAEVTLILEPRLALLRYRTDIRVFRDKTAETIANEVLSELGVKVEKRLSGSYVPRGYCVQMRESTLDFAQRLLEDDGIGYFVADDGTVVFFDSTEAYDDSLGVYPFATGSSLERPVDCVFEVGSAGEATPGKVSLRDFNHEHPSLNMDVSAPGPWQAGPEHYDYPGEYALPGEGAIKARWRAEALSCQASRTVGKSYSPAFRPGARFILAGGPPGVADGGYVLRAIEHRWSREDEGFAVAFESQPETKLFRPLCLTYVPRLLNPLTGYCSGPPGEDDIYTDKWGRAKVHFPWDRRQPKDDRCSDWIPVIQDNTGHSVGIGRIGWELACQFMEGDPDRPIVIGRVFNPEDPFSETLPQNKTKTSLRSLTSPRSKDHTAASQSRNQILFEDAMGREEIMMVAQKDQNVVVANDKVERINDISSAQVTGNETIIIGEEHHADVMKNAHSNVGGDQSWTVAGSRTFKIDGNHSEQIEGSHTLTIGGSHFRRIGDTDSQSVEKTLKETIGGLVLEASVKTNDNQGSKLSAVTVGGAIIEVARMNKQESTGKIRIETVGGISFAKSDKEIANRIGKTRRTLVGAALIAEALKNAAISGADKLKTRSLTANIDGAKLLTIRVGETEIVMRDGVLSLKAKTDITMKATADNKQGVGEAKQI
ncbi:MAG: type VI secretion system tip protein VgrG [Polyangiaceae bacterium]|jgi:type VI secretion system secreted protein VgrG|nr:type VI secretion system tip protein VgrG [Polyangiaceae bacterium]